MGTVKLFRWVEHNFGQKGALEDLHFDSFSGDGYQRFLWYSEYNSYRRLTDQEVGEYKYVHFVWSEVVMASSFHLHLICLHGSEDVPFLDAVCVYVHVQKDN